MPTPFPGMDPYLEGPIWPDFHLIFIAAWRVALNRLLPAGYVARANERASLIEYDPSERKLVSPDVAVVRDGYANRGEHAGAATALMEPIAVDLPNYVEIEERWIEIKHEPGDELVAVVEILSPWNKKPGAGNGKYLARRMRLVQQAVHVVELDLLLGGQRLPMAGPLPKADYYAIVSRSDRRPHSEVYAWRLRDRLPRIPIPLLPPDPDVTVDLQAIFSSAYEMGGYGQALRYTSAPPAPVPAPDQQWVIDVAKSAIPG